MTSCRTRFASEPLLSLPAIALMLCVAGCASSVGISEAEAENALWETLGPRSHPACVPYSGPNSTADPEACEADKRAQREAFSVELTECSEGAEIGTYPDAVTCTLSFRRAPAGQPQSRMVVFYRESDRWVAVPI